MNINEWRNGINLCIDNALRFFKDGEILMKNGSYGHACFSFITAFEELGVAYYIIDHFNTPQPAKLKKFLNHVKKLSLTSFRSTPYLTGDHNILLEYLKLAEKQLTTQNSFEESRKTEREILAFGNELRRINSLKYIRNRGLYIELNKSKTTFQTPKEIHHGYALILFLVVSAVLPLIQVEIDQVFKFGTRNVKYSECEAALVQAMIKGMELVKILTSLVPELTNRSIINVIKSPDF